MSIYKAYDIRGVVPGEFHAGLARDIAHAFVDVMGARRLLLGRDMRTHSPGIAAAAAQGAMRAGADVVDVGLVTTPMSYFGVGRLGLDAGLMVTASHNPAEYNGFKLCGAGAAPVSGDREIPEIARRVAAGGLKPAAKAGSLSLRDVRADYVAHVTSLGGKGRALRVAVDGMNGMGGPVALEILSRLGHRVDAILSEPDGAFPHHEANPLKEENLRDLKALVLRTGADLGVGLDGDADRAIFVDEAGATVPNDLATALLARGVLTRHPRAAVVYDLRSSWALREEIERLGGVPVRERVGHSFLKGTMRARKSPFGGELSGHTYWEENYTADSAMIAIVRMLDAVREGGKPLSGLLRPLRRYAGTGEVNFVVEDKDARIREMAETFRDGKVDFLDGVTVAYADWWFNVRPSNTEPLLRLVLEARTEALRERGLARVLAILGEPDGKSRSDRTARRL